MGAAGAGVGGAWLFNQSRFGRTNNQQQQVTASLAKIVDVMIPEDSHPGAISVGVDAVIGEKVNSQPQMKELVTRLLLNIETAALSREHKPLMSLNQETTLNLLNHLLSKDAPRHTRLDLQRLRNNIMQSYYSSPQGHQSLNYLAPVNYPSYTR